MNLSNIIQNVKNIFLSKEAIANNMEKQTRDQYEQVVQNITNNDQNFEKVFNNFTFFNNYFQSIPILKLTVDRITRIKNYYYFWKTSSILASALKAKSAFTFCSGFTLECSYNSADVPDFLPNLSIDSTIYSDDDTPVHKAVSDFVVGQSEVYIDELELIPKLCDWYMKHLRDGELYIYRIDSWPDEVVDSILKEEDFNTRKLMIVEATKKYGQFRVVGFQELNTSAVLPIKDEFGDILAYKLQDKRGATSSIMPPYKILDFKRGGEDYSLVGDSDVHPIIKELLARESLIISIKAGADRYTLPFGILKTGLMKKENGIESPYVNQAMIDLGNAALQSYDPTKGKVVTLPFYYNLEFHGAEGKMMKVEKTIELLDHEILAGLGVPPALLSGTFNTYGTAKIAVQLLEARVKPDKDQFKFVLENKLFKVIALMRNWWDNTGNLVFAKVCFKDLNIADIESYRNLMLGLAQLKSTGGEGISYETFIRNIGEDPDIERANLKAEQMEKDILSQPTEKRDLEEEKDVKIKYLDKTRKREPGKKPQDLRNQSPREIVNRTPVTEDYSTQHPKTASLEIQLAELEDKVEEMEDILDNLKFKR